MNDEIRQIREKKFYRVILTLVLLSLGVGVTTVLADGLESPWFIRSMALLLFAVMASILRWFSRLVVASYVLVLWLLGLVAGMLLQADVGAAFTLYLFLPVMVIAGSLLTPAATLAAAVLSILLIYSIGVFAWRFSPAELGFLFPPVVLIIFTAWVAADSKWNMDWLGERLVEGKVLLRRRTLELLDVLQELKKLRYRAAVLEQQALQARAAAEDNRPEPGKDTELYTLITGAIPALDVALQELRQVLKRLESPESGEQALLLEEAWQQVDYLTGLMTNLEEMARIDRAAVELRYQSVDVGRMLSELAGAIRGLVREKKVEVRCQVQENLPPVPADPDRLRQALLHVLNNAIKYTDEGTIDIQAEVNNGEVLIFVADTGIGMRREEKELIFEKFGRGSTPLAQQRQGSGLGLSISRGLVALHGGRMWATTVLGVGATFYIALPLAAPGSIPGGRPGDETVASVPSAEAAAVERSVTLAELAEHTGSGVRANFSPVARFSPRYINCFAWVLIGLLFSVVVTVAVLAWLNNDPVQNNPAAAVDKAAAPMTVAPDLDGLPEGVISPTVSPPPISASPSPSAALANQGPATLTPSITFPGSAKTSTAVSMVETSTPALPAPSPTFTPVPATPTPTRTVTPSSIASPRLPPPAPTPTPPATLMPTYTPSAPTPTHTVIPTSTVSPTLPPPATLTPVPATLRPIQTTAPTFTASPTRLPPATLTPTYTPPAPTPTISPAPALTSRLAFTVKQAGQNAGAAFVNLDEGSGVATSLAVETIDSGRLSWSPGGLTLLFTSNREGALEIYAAGTACFLPSTDCEAQPRNLTRADGDDSQPAWSPDGQAIAFSSGRSGNIDIYVMPASCAASAGPCPESPVQLTTSRGFDEWPAWSPDGRRLAFVSDRDGNEELYVVGAGGGEEQRLTHHPADDWPVDWSPDGRWLLFASNRDGNWNLYLVAAACAGSPAGCEGGAFRLTDDPGDEREPVWSPNGLTVAFASNRGGNWDIYTLPVPTGGLAVVAASAWSQVTQTPADERYPVWVRGF